MKKGLTVLSVLAVFSLIVYFLLDRKLYFYGKNNFNFYHELPLKIEPQNWGYDNGNLGFVLLDESEMTVIAQGSKYWSSDFEVNEVLKYGYNNEKLIALVADTTGKKRYIECLKNDNVSSKQGMKINVLDNEFPINYKDYKWIVIKDVSYRSFELTRNYSALIFLLLLLISIYLGVMIKRKKLK